MRKKKIGNEGMRGEERGGGGGRVVGTGWDSVKIAAEVCNLIIIIIIVIIFKYNKSFKILINLVKTRKENLKLCKSKEGEGGELEKVNKINNENIALVLKGLKDEAKKTVGEKKRYKILLAGFKRKIKCLIKGWCFLEERRKGGYGILYHTALRSIEHVLVAFNKDNPLHVTEK